MKKNYQYVFFLFSLCLLCSCGKNMDIADENVKAVKEIPLTADTSGEYLSLSEKEKDPKPKEKKSGVTIREKNASKVNGKKKEIQPEVTTKESPQKGNLSNTPRIIVRGTTPPNRTGESDISVTKKNNFSEISEDKKNPSFQITEHSTKKAEDKKDVIIGNQKQTDPSSPTDAITTPEMPVGKRSYSALRKEVLQDILSNGNFILDHHCYRMDENLQKELEDVTQFSGASLADYLADDFIVIYQNNIEDIDQMQIIFQKLFRKEYLTTEEATDILYLLQQG